jgi:hypothetical protein
MVTEKCPTIEQLIESVRTTKESLEAYTTVGTSAPWLDLILAGDQSAHFYAKGTTKIVGTEVTMTGVLYAWVTHKHVYTGKDVTTPLRDVGTLTVNKTKLTGSFEIDTAARKNSGSAFS